MKMFFVALITLQIVLSVDCKLEAVDEIDCLRIANDLRELHPGTPMMVWNTELASAAQVWAEKLLTMDKLHHDTNRGGAGENIYRMESPRAAKCAEAEHAWYVEFDNYDYATHQSTNGEPIGHFAQVVWRASTQLGIGLATKTLPDGNVLTTVVARYNPAGNTYVEGKRDLAFKENILNRTSNVVTPSIFQLDTSLCKDSHPGCTYFEEAGYCESQRSIMKSNCPKICGIC